MPLKNASFIKPDVEFSPSFAWENYAPIFRKKFAVDDTGNAKLYVCGLGYGYYYINGVKVTGDLFTAPVSEYTRTLWYNVYDVSHLLHKGENTIAAICGNGFYNETVETSWGFHKAVWRDNPKLIALLTVGGRTVLRTDDTWKCLPRGAIIFNQLRMGEYYDANRCGEDWFLPEFDDSEWPCAVTDSNPPTGIFRECTCEPIREHEIYKPIRIVENGPNRYLFDMGQNMSGYVRLTVRGNKGDELTIRYAECIDDEMQLAYYGMDTYYCKNGGFQTDRFICSDKEVTWSPRFAYHGFRYIEISGIHADMELEVSAVFVHQAIKRRTEFHCSDPYFNKMFRCGVMSSWSNMFYMLTDCPTREKFGWANDAQSSTEQMLTNFETEDLLTKWLQDIRDAMRPDGSLPGIIPTAGWGYHWGNGPVSDGLLFEIPYRVYLHTGNCKPLVESLEYFEKYLKYLDTRKNEAGLVDFGLDDWAAPGNIHIVETEFINAVLIYYFLKVTHLAAKLAERDNADSYLEEAGKQRYFIMERYLDAAGRCTINEQCSVSMMIYYDLFEDLAPLKEQLAALLEANDYHLKCGMVGMRRILHALTRCGLSHYACKLLKAEGYPGYKVWMDRDATTLWEKWDINTISDSKNHHMYSDFMSWFIKTIGGIRLNEEKPGELEFILDPDFVEGIDSADLTYHTANGDIRVSWHRENNKICMAVTKDESVKLIYKGEPVTSLNNQYEIGGNLT